MPAPAPSNYSSGGGDSGKGSRRRLNQIQSVGTGLFNSGFIDELRSLHEELHKVVRTWLKKDPDPDAQTALLENINTIFWEIEDKYLPHGEDAEDDAALLLEQLKGDLQAAALSLRRLQSSDLRPTINDLVETHNLLIGLHGTLEVALSRANRSSA
jgi:hypothetical protein